MRRVAKSLHPVAVLLISPTCLVTRAVLKSPTRGGLLLLLLAVVLRLHRCQRVVLRQILLRRRASVLRSGLDPIAARRRRRRGDVLGRAGRRLHVHHEVGRVELLGRRICELIHELRSIFVDLPSQIRIKLQILSISELPDTR